MFFHINSTTSTVRPPIKLNNVKLFIKTSILAAIASDCALIRAVSPPRTSSKDLFPACLSFLASSKNSLEIFILDLFDD